MTVITELILISLCDGMFLFVRPMFDDCWNFIDWFVEDISYGVFEFE